MIGLWNGNAKGRSYAYIWALSEIGIPSYTCDTLTDVFQYFQSDRQSEPNTHSAKKITHLNNAHSEG